LRLRHSANVTRGATGALAGWAAGFALLELL
jgi:hypothetical protein